MEWVSVKEKLPSLGELVEISKMGYNIQKCKLRRVEDDCFARGFYFEWEYPSGIYAFSFDASDEWRTINQKQ